MTPAFVVVGTGRHGSGYTAALLTAAGIPCGHEQWWNPFNSHDQGIVGDSSWCALPIGLRGYPGIVVHQVRHPVDVITSFTRAPINPDTQKPWWDLHRRLVPEPHDDPLRYAAEAWLAYTVTAADYTDMVWRLEDITAEHIHALGDMIGHPVDPARAEHALATVPRTTNRHHHGQRLVWRDIKELDPHLADLIRDRADRYGY